MPAIIIAIIVVLSGGVSVAARSALPGDVLYPVKLEINENLKTAFAFSEEAKANAETSIAAERLEEAEQLAARGELGTDVATKLSQRFEARAENLNDIIDRLEADGKTEAAANLTAALETTLSVHNQILRRLKEREVQPKVEVRAEKAAEERARMEEKIRTEVRPDVQAAAEGKMNAAANKIAEVKAKIDRVEAKDGAEAVAVAKTKLVVAETVFAEGKAKFEAKTYGEAFALFQESMRLAQGAQVTIDIESKIDLDVRAKSNSEVDEENDDNGSDASKTEEKSDVEIRLKTR